MLGMFGSNPSKASPRQAAMMWLQSAIKRHERHMNGTENTSRESQQKMMDEMTNAMSALRRM